MKIRITSVPPGEAPHEIRAAWIGLEIPVASVTAGPKKYVSVGVLSGPKTKWAQRIAYWFGRLKLQEGFAVNASNAIALLAQEHPEAALWWQQNVPHALQPGKYFIFAASCCEEVDDDPSNPRYGKLPPFRFRK